MEIVRFEVASGPNKISRENGKRRVVMAANVRGRDRGSFIVETQVRGGDILIGAYNYLDLTPKGRKETGIMDWLRHHDRYPA